MHGSEGVTQNVVELLDALEGADATEVEKLFHPDSRGLRLSELRFQQEDIQWNVSSGRTTFVFSWDDTHLTLVRDAENEEVELDFADD